MNPHSQLRHLHTSLLGCEFYIHLPFLGGLCTVVEKFNVSKLIIYVGTSILIGLLEEIRVNI